MTSRENYTSVGCLLQVFPFYIAKKHNDYTEWSNRIRAVYWFSTQKRQISTVEDEAMCQKEFSSWNPFDAENT